MILRGTESPSLAGRLIARWDVSRFGMMPSFLSVICLPVYFATLAGLHAMGGPAVKPAVIAIIGIQLALFAFDLGRGVWSFLHPCASARWLRAVRAAIGEDLFSRASQHLVVCHGGDADYVIKRADMVTAVRVEKRRDRDAARCGQGVRLDELSAQQA